jgi:hypothetical protein
MGEEVLMNRCRTLLQTTAHHTFMLEFMHNKLLQPANAVFAR